MRALGLALGLALVLAAGCRAPEPSLETTETPRAPAAPRGGEPPALVRPLSLRSGTTAVAISGGGSHRYRLELPPGSFADLSVEQRGVDVALSLEGADGRGVRFVDSPNGTEGPEPLPILGAAAAQTVQVTATDAAAPPGRYVWQVRAVRPATERDRARVAAETAFATAEVLRRKRDAASSRAAAAAAEKAAEAFAALGLSRRAADAFYAAARSRAELGEPATTRSLLLAALPAFRAEGDRRAVARTLNSLGVAELALGEPAAASARYREALALLAGLDDPRAEATAWNNLGRAEATAGHAEPALAAYDRALALWRRLGLGEQEGVTLANRGSLYAALGEEARARDDLDQAMPRVAGRPEEARARAERGYLALRAGRLSDASADLSRALALYGKAGNRLGEAATRNSLGLLDRARGSPDRAHRAFERALAGFSALGDRPNEAAVRINLGRLYLARGDAAGAEAAFRAAQEGSAAAGRPNREGEAWTGLSQALRARGMPVAALRAAEAGLSRYEALRAEPGSLELRAAFFASRQEAYAEAVDLAMELARLHPKSGYAARAFEIGERGRARSLLDALSEAGARPFREMPEAQRARLEAAGARVEAAEGRRLAAVEDGAPASVEAAERELRRAFRDLERIEAEARGAAGAAAAEVPLSLAQIRARTLPAEALLLAYALGERRSFLWVVGRGRFDAYVLPARATLEAAAQKAHRALASPDRTLARAEAERALAELSRLLLGPAGGLSARRLAIVPDGALHLVPFSALPDPDAPAEPLGARHEVATVPSASSLAAIRAAALRRPPPPGSVAAFGDPVYDAADPRVAAPAGRPASPSPRGFARLPASRAEARGLLALAPPGEKMLALDFAARRDLALSGALSRFRVIHFATHAVVDAEHPELSGIALSAVDRAGRPRLGLVRAHEIYRLRLSADLVVLSACETALGREVRGEGVAGLTRAFLHAGARRLLVSLWAVDDRETGALMAAFYRGYFGRGLSPAAALGKAQAEMRRDPARRDPYHWAGFVLQGDGG